MSGEDRAERDTPPPPASLLAQIGRRAAGPAMPVRGSEARRTLVVFGWAVALGLTILSGGALIQARRAEAEAASVGDRAAEAARARDALERLARAMAVLPLDAQLARVRAALPADRRVIEAGRDEAGTLTIILDTSDPDALRAALSGTALARFRTVDQAVGADGTIRVRLSGTLG